MDLHHGNNFAKDFLADDGMAEVVYYVCSILADCKDCANPEVKSPAELTCHRPVET